MTTTDRNPKALLLTADAEAVQSLSAELARRGFDVLTAADGARGVELLLEHLLALDVLVTDVDLPGRDAAALLRLVRVAGGERELAIVVRGHALSSLSRAALRSLGADAVAGATDRAERVATLVEDAIAARACDGAEPAAVARLEHAGRPGRTWRLALPAAAVA